MTRSEIGFTNFASSIPIEFRLYTFGLSSENVGVRRDDITLTGPQEVVIDDGTEVADFDRLFFRVRIQP